MKMLKICACVALLTMLGVFLGPKIYWKLFGPAPETWLRDSNRSWDETFTNSGWVKTGKHSWHFSNQTQVSNASNGPSSGKP